MNLSEREAARKLAEESEQYAEEARRRERENDYHRRGSEEGKPSESDDITILLEDAENLRDALLSALSWGDYTKTSYSPSEARKETP
jgi:hypothetical protein